MSAWYNKTMAFPGELNINYYRGDTHEFKVYPQKTDGSVFNLSDFGNPTFTIATERGSNPTPDSLMVTGRIFGSAKISLDNTYITCAITPENGALMDPDKTYVYDIQMYAQGADTYDKVFTILTGSISVRDDVTQDIGNPNRAIPTYRVIYHNTNATSGVVPVDTNGYLPNQHIVVANNGTLARVGYTFGGWTKFADNSGTVYSAGDFIPISSDIKLYPKWIPPTVTYDNQSATTSQVGGSTSYIPQSAIVSIPTTPPVRTGHVFGGWFTGPAGSGTQVTNNSYTPLSPYGTVTLYAKWTVA
jgi:uncharacterized repeat protein (TIGR02543 family)